MASEQIITLSDIASASGMPLGWNTIVLRARYALNFKGIAHKTVWLEYPDIAPTLRSIGAAPTTTKPDGSPQYTLPVIVDPSCRTASGEPIVISDSWAIAEYLDNAYPSPSLLLPGGTKAMQMLFQEHPAKSLFMSFVPIVAPLVVPYLNEASRPYWHETRGGYFGKKLEDVCPKGSPEWDGAWRNVQKSLTDIAVLLDKNGTEGSTLVMGNNVVFVDFVIVSILDTIALMAPDGWEKVRKWDDGRWERLRNHCTAWRKVC